MKLKRNIKGQALTEFALIFPLMFALVGGAIDWGLTFLVSHVVQNAVQDGARLAATQGSVVEADVEAAVQSRIPDIPLFSAFRDPANIIVTPPNLADCPNAVVIVQTSGTYSFFFLRVLNLIASGFPTSVTISRSSSMVWERQVC